MRRLRLFAVVVGLLAWATVMSVSAATAFAASPPGLHAASRAASIGVAASDLLEDPSLELRRDEPVRRFVAPLRRSTALAASARAPATSEYLERAAPRLGRADLGSSSPSSPGAH